VRSWWLPGFWGKNRIQDSGFRIQGSEIMVVAWFLGEKQDSGFGIQDSGKHDRGGCVVSGERIGFGFGSGFGIQVGAIILVAWVLGDGGSSSGCKTARRCFSLNPESWILNPDLHSC
jgi:hypothetical protein